MGTAVVAASGLGKRYRMGGARGTLVQWLGGLWSGAPAPAAHWALRDVSFSVGEGEVVGVLGRNGAGKSTLLKLMTGITAPTEGWVETLGRVGSLLEVGTGFHPELSGRDNVFLYGAILGMRRAEIRRKFDAIVDFSEVAPFIDTPVKHFSSGMYMRLAFAVAAHLEPDVLLVDEVLAVGDVGFQQKCLALMSALMRRGMTIFFTSHNLAAVQSICTRALLIEKGQLQFDGPPHAAVERFRTLLRSVDRIVDSPHFGRASAAVTLHSVELLDESGQPLSQLAFGASPRVRFRVEVRRRIERPLLNVGFLRADGVVVCNFSNRYDGVGLPPLEGDVVVECRLPPLYIVPDYYLLGGSVGEGGAGDTVDLATSQPLVGDFFSDFKVDGSALGPQDGVFHQAASDWRVLPTAAD